MASAEWVMGKLTILKLWVQDYLWSEEGQGSRAGEQTVKMVAGDKSQLRPCSQGPQAAAKGIVGFCKKQGVKDCSGSIGRG
jgi:hypothetical protein